MRAEDSEKNLICLFNYPYDPEKLLITNYIPIHAVLFSRELIEVNNIRFDEHLNVFEDWDFWLQLARHTTFIHVDQISAVYHAQGESGVGLAVNKDLQKKGREQLFDKWRLLWTARDIDNIAQYAINKEKTADYQNTTLISHEKHIHELNQLLASRDDYIQELNQELNIRDNHIQELNQELCSRDNQTADLKQIIEDILRSRSWRLTAPLRYSFKKRN